MSRALGAAYNFKQKVKTSGRAFMQWKMFAHFGRLRRQHQKMVERHSKLSYFKKAWNSWTAHHNQTKNKKIEETKKKEADEYVEMISMKYQKEISTLQSKLSETLAELHAVTQNKKEMQNQLKRAFMRGLCAMNLEAMDVLNPEDANELGISGVLKEDMNPNILPYKPQTHQTTKPTFHSNPVSTTARMVNADYTSTSRLGQPDFAGLLPSNQSDVKDKFNSIDLFMQQSIKRDYPTLHQDEISIRNHDHPTRAHEASTSKQYDPNIYKSSLVKHDALDSRQPFTSGENQLTNTSHSQATKVQTDNVDDMYENMLREFREREERAVQDSGFKEDNKKVTILREPLAESKEHLWKQAPVVGKKPTADVDPQPFNPKASFPVPTQISALYTKDSSNTTNQPKSILKKKLDDHQRTESDRDQDRPMNDSEEEDEGQVIRYDQEDIKKSMQFTANSSHLSKQSKAPSPHPTANTKKPTQASAKASTSAPSKPVSNSIATRIQKKNNL